MKNPFAFFIGCQRSGTTLLQHMVDSHPQIAVMQENGWFGTWFELRTGITPEGFVTGDFIPRLLRTCKHADLGVTAGDLSEIVARGGVHYSDFISELFDRYGAHRGKSLVGSKNPDYTRRLDTLRELWPRAKFVHIVRDGRDVCLCAANRWKDKPDFKGFPFFLYEEPDRVFDSWSEDPVATTALWWELNVRLGRTFGGALQPDMYYEMRYEDLVADPEAECRKLCGFLSLPFHEAMLRHQENFKPRRTANGTVLHASVGLPVTAGLRDWRSQMTAPELERFESAAGALMDELGYERGAAGVSARQVADSQRIRHLFEERVAAAKTSLHATPVAVGGD